MTGITTKVLTYTQAHPAAKPRHIAAALGLTARQVDNVLYRYRQALDTVWDVRIRMG